MNDLFIRLFLDEDADVLLADLIRARGFDVQTTQQAGQRTRDDASQLAYAVSQGRTLLTHNRVDFESLAQEYFTGGRPHAGVIIAVRRPPYELARRVLVILNAITADEMQNQIRYI